MDYLIRHRLLNTVATGPPYRAVLRFLGFLNSLWALGRFRIKLPPSPVFLQNEGVRRGDSTLRQAAPAPIPVRALIHVTFHMHLGRLGYVREVVRGIQEARFTALDLIVDTNSPKTASWLSEFGNDVKFRVHQSLGQSVYADLGVS